MQADRRGGILAGTLALGVALATMAQAVPIGVTAKKLIGIDKITAASKAKVVYVSQDTAELEAIMDFTQALCGPTASGNYWSVSTYSPIPAVTGVAGGVFSDGVSNLYFKAGGPGGVSPRCLSHIMDAPAQRQTAPTAHRPRASAAHIARNAVWIHRRRGWCPVQHARANS